MFILYKISEMRLCGDQEQSIVLLLTVVIQFKNNKIGLMHNNNMEQYLEQASCSLSPIAQELFRDSIQNFEIIEKNLDREQLTLIIKELSFAANKALKELITLDEENGDLKQEINSLLHQNKDLRERVSLVQEEYQNLNILMSNKEEQNRHNIMEMSMSSSSMLEELNCQLIREKETTLEYHTLVKEYENIMKELRSQQHIASKLKRQNQKLSILQRDIVAKYTKLEEDNCTLGAQLEENTEELNNYQEENNKLEDQIAELRLVIQQLQQRDSFPATHHKSSLNDFDRMDNVLKLKEIQEGFHYQPDFTEVLRRSESGHSDCEQPQATIENTQDDKKFINEGSHFVIFSEQPSTPLQTRTKIQDRGKKTNNSAYPSSGNSIQRQQHNQDDSNIERLKKNQHNEKKQHFQSQHEIQPEKRERSKTKYTPQQTKEFIREGEGPQPFMEPFSISYITSNDDSKGFIGLARPRNSHSPSHDNRDNKNKKLMVMEKLKEEIKLLHEQIREKNYQITQLEGQLQIIEDKKDQIIHRLELTNDQQTQTIKQIKADLQESEKVILNLNKKIKLGQMELSQEKRNTQNRMAQLKQKAQQKMKQASKLCEHYELTIEKLQKQKHKNQKLLQPRPHRSLSNNSKISSKKLSGGGGKFKIGLQAGVQTTYTMCMLDQIKKSKQKGLKDLVHFQVRYSFKDAFSQYQSLENQQVKNQMLVRQKQQVLSDYLEKIQNKKIQDRDFIEIGVNTEYFTPILNQYFSQTEHADPTYICRGVGTEPTQTSDQWTNVIEQDLIQELKEVQNLAQLFNYQDQNQDQAQEHIHQQQIHQNHNQIHHLKKNGELNYDKNQKITEKLQQFEQIICKNKKLQLDKQNIVLACLRQKTLGFQVRGEQANCQIRNVKKNIYQMINYFHKKGDKSGRKKRFYLLKVKQMNGRKEQQEDDLLLWAEGLISRKNGNALYMQRPKKLQQQKGCLILGNCEILVQNDCLQVRVAGKKNYFQGDMGDQSWKIVEVTGYIEN